ncbi:NlpC/P60 family protein [Streptomyces sp. NPDC001262]|uniref:C40 family peptidase n=1 Tax=Streptomyces sp. NPDC001262 TaxID=3364552 RepID=UPI0036738C07
MRVPGRRTGAAAGRGRRVATATALVCAAGTLLALAAPGAYAEPGPPAPSLEDVHKQVETLYRQAEVATDAYNAASAQQRLQEKNVADIARALTEAQQRLDRLKNQAGALARAQYRNGGMSPQAQLFFASSPGAFFDGVSLLRKGQQATRDLIAEQTAARAELDRYAKAADERRKRLDADRREKEDAKKEVESRLSAAKELESRLQEKERERLRQLEEEQARQAQEKWLAGQGGVLTGSGATSSEGRQAVAFATAQIGKDYVWGAEGPDTYDCSGLTLKAWAAAGRAIPRTSQEQWRQLPRVDVKDMRPGDLIIYFADASHVGMYVGDGMIVHAPRPGRQVTTTGAGSMPVLGVVRPG